MTKHDNKSGLLAKALNPILIMGSKWGILIVETEEFQEVYGEFARGVVSASDRQIIFAGNPNKGTIRHELLHAYMETLPILSAQLSPVQVEEVCGDILAEYWDEMARITNYIYRESRKEK